MGWDAKKLHKKLQELCQLDIDAVRAYEQALKNIDVPEVQGEIDQFKQDHERHIEHLSSAIIRLGEEPPKMTVDLKGFFIEGFTAVRSMTGTEGALKAMRGNEALTNKVYREALSWDMPDELRIMIENHYADERRHLEYIQRAIDDRIWEDAGITAA